MTTANKNIILSSWQRTFQSFQRVLPFLSFPAMIDGLVSEANERKNLVAMNGNEWMKNERGRYMSLDIRRLVPQRSPNVTSPNEKVLNLKIACRRCRAQRTKHLTKWSCYVRIGPRYAGLLELFYYLTFLIRTFILGLFCGARRFSFRVIGRRRFFSLTPAWLVKRLFLWLRLRELL